MFCIIFSFSCSSGYYQKETKTQTTGLDFSNGRWLLGNVDVDPDIKDKLMVSVDKDFRKYLNDRFTNSLNAKSLLVATNVPLNPSKSFILDLKKGTNYDYFINIKCHSEKSSSLESIAGKYVDRFTVDQHFYAKEITTEIVELEVYDLNLGMTIYSQRVRGFYDANAIKTSKYRKKLIIGCYERIMKDIGNKSQYKFPA